MKSLTALILLAALLLIGCGDHKSEAKRIDIKADKSFSAAKEIEANLKRQSHKPMQEDKKASKPSSSHIKISSFYQVFKDGAKIDPSGKPMLLLFGQSADAYTQRLMHDVTSNKSLAKKIKAVLTPIYIDVREQKIHKFIHNSQAMEVDTKTLVGIYHIDLTPTLIFTDEKGKTLFIVPGYVTPKSFMIIIDFIKEGVWRGKQRAKISKALKDYYLKHNIDFSGAKR